VFDKAAIRELFSGRIGDDEFVTRFGGDPRAA